MLGFFIFMYGHTIHASVIAYSSLITSLTIPFYLQFVCGIAIAAVLRVK